MIAKSLTESAPFDAPREPNLLSALLRCAESVPTMTALRDSHRQSTFSWSEYEAAVARLAAGLQSLGCRRGDHVALLISNRPEWQLADLAAVAIGAVPFSLYTNTTAAQTCEHLRASGARVLFAERRLLDRLNLGSELDIDHLVLIDQGPEPVVLSHSTVSSWEDASSTRPADLRALAQHIETGDVATLIFTSGTTGTAKQVQLTHGNVLASAGWVARGAGMDRAAPGRVVSYLPHAHIVDRVVGHYLPLVTGASVITINDARTVFDHLPAIQPTFFTSVPRLWEALRSRLTLRFDGDSTGIWQQRINRSLSHVFEVRASGLAGNAAVVPPEQDRSSWEELRQELGLGACRWLVTGSAPLSLGTHTFFEAIGLPLHDCWGLAECAALASVNLPDRRQVGSVGRAVAGSELRIADDGEVLIRGPHVMLGYRDNRSANAEVFTPGGWFRTGDLGELREGYLHLIGRKKDILITEGGENVAPARIESALVDASPLIAQACVVGDGRPGLAALLVLDASTADALDDDKALADAVEAAVAAANETLSRPEQVRHHAFLRDGFTHETGELTPTLKMRRDAVTAKYAALIDAMYDVV